MTRPPGDSSELPFSVRYSARVPPPQEVYFVTITDWRRIKESVQRIRSRESNWFTALWSFVSFALSFLAGTVTLEQQTGVGFFFRAGFYTATGATLLAAVICWFGYEASKESREDDIALVIGRMEDVEQNAGRLDEHQSPAGGFPQGQP